jgi:hypothetical protein
MLCGDFNLIYQVADKNNDRLSSDDGSLLLILK